MEEKHDIHRAIVDVPEKNPQRSDIISHHIKKIKCTFSVTCRRSASDLFSDPFYPKNNDTHCKRLDREGV